MSEEHHREIEFCNRIYTQYVDWRDRAVKISQFKIKNRLLFLTSDTVLSFPIWYTLNILNAWVSSYLFQLHWHQPFWSWTKFLNKTLKWRVNLKTNPKKKITKKLNVIKPATISFSISIIIWQNIGSMKMKQFQNWWERKWNQKEKK